MQKIFSFIGILCLLLTLSACRDDDVYAIGHKDGVSAQRIIRITEISQTTLPADTTTLSTITLAITKDAGADYRNINITTSLGFFSNGTKSISIPVDVDGRAHVDIRSAQPGIARVSSTVNTTKIDTSIVFTAAAPDEILVTADKYEVDTPETLQVTATLVRNPGKGVITDPAKVFFSTTPAAMANKLIIPPFAFTSNKAAVISVSNPFKATGTAVITAKTVNQTGDTLKRAISVVFK